MRRSIRYEGRVQGVGFRATACHVAASFHVVGWVRNESDGAVRMEVQGDPGQVDAMLAEVDRRLARFIRARESVEMPDLTGETGFVIRH